MDKIAEFKKLISGKVLLPGEEGYDESRAIWNGMFDKKPAVITRCLHTQDVSQAVRFAREQNLTIAVKGGGHNSAGNAVCDQGMMIDLSLMQKVSVNKDEKTAFVEGGALLGAVDEGTQEHGLAVSAGIVSHTGVGGLTLGGGFGWISRKYGLTIDNLISVELVTADGSVVHASDSENEDLFWAVRGGGGNFGIVTSFEFRAADIGTEVYTGPVVKRFEDAREYLRFHRDYVRNMPDEMTVWMVIRHAPPLPFIPEEYHGRLVVLIPFVWLGDPEEGRELIRPIREFGETIGDGSGVKPWVAWQSAFDGLVEHGARNYWKSHHLKELSDPCIDQIVSYAAKMPHSECEVFIPHMEGAPSRVDSLATAFPHRKTPFVLNLHSRWQNQEDDQRCMNWAREFHEATQAFSQGVYVNFLSEEGNARIREAYTDKVWARLVQAKKRWDPQNIFHMNQNIPPE